MNRIEKYTLALLIPYYDFVVVTILKSHTDIANNNIFISNDIIKYTRIQIMLHYLADVKCHIVKLDIEED